MNEKQEQEVIKQLFKKYHFKSDSPNSFRFQTPDGMAYFIRSCAKHLIDRDYPLEDYYNDGEQRPNSQTVLAR